MWVCGNLVADPSKESIPFDGRVVGVDVVVKAFFAQRHPDSPQEWFFDSVNRDLKNSSNEVVSARFVCDGAEITADFSHGCLLFIGQAGILVWHLIPNARRPLMDFTAAGTFEGEYGGHGG